MISRILTLLGAKPRELVPRSMYGLRSCSLPPSDAVDHLAYPKGMMWLGGGKSVNVEWFAKSLSSTCSPQPSLIDPPRLSIGRAPCQAFLPSFSEGILAAVSLL